MMAIKTDTGRLLIVKLIILQFPNMLSLTYRPSLLLEVASRLKFEKLFPFSLLLHCKNLHKLLKGHTLYYRKQIQNLMLTHLRYCKHHSKFYYVNGNTY